MYVDLNSVPEDFRTGDLINVWQQQGILVNDPTKTINTIIENA